MTCSRRSAAPSGPSLRCRALRVPSTCCSTASPCWAPTAAPPRARSCSELRLRSLQGREAEASALIAHAIKLAAASAQEMAAIVGHWGAAVLYNGLARYEEALSAAQRATSNPFEPFVSIFALPELVE